MKAQTILAFAVLIAVCAGAFWFVTQRLAPGNSNSNRQVPLSGQDTTNRGYATETSVAVKAKPTPIQHSATVSKGKVHTWTCSVNKPGLLQGTWHSKGKSAGIKGAADDTLVGFTLRGSDDAVIEKLDHPFSGNFSVRCSGPGNYTFAFDNSGIVRSSDRLIEIDGTFQPD